MRKILLFFSAFAFLFPSTKFIWPLFPFTTLTSNFYEYRTTHFHGGVDLSTNRKEGLPVRAAADGEIFRIFYGWYGFGRAVYIRHAGGYVTVYGHLRKFENRVLGLEDLIHKKAREKGLKYLNTYYLDRPIRVKRGQIIGYSGAMGAGGPHLHFEVRKGELEPLNPLYFLHAQIGQVFFNKFVLEIATPGSFVGMKPTRFYGKFIRKAGSYGYLTIPVHGCFRIFVEAFEKCKGRCGVYSLQAFLDGRKIFSFKGDKFTFSQNYLAGRLFNISISSTKSPFYSIPDFSSPPVCIKDGIHKLVLIGKNEKGKESRAVLNFVHVAPPFSDEGVNISLVKEAFVKKGSRWIKTGISELKNGHVYRIRSKWKKFFSPWIVFYKGTPVDSKEAVSPEEVEYHLGWKMITVSPYFEGSPVFCNSKCFLVLPSDGNGVVVKNGFRFLINENISNVKINFEKKDFPCLEKVGISRVDVEVPPDLSPISDAFLISPQEILFRKQAEIIIKIPDNETTDRAGIYRKFRNSWAYLEGEKRGQWWIAKTKLFGVFVLARDLKPPRIFRLSWSNNEVIVRIKDHGSGVNPLKIAFDLDGKRYIPDFDYDSGRAIQQVKLSPGWHFLKVTAEDFAGNRSFRIFRFKKK